MILCRRRSQRARRFNSERLGQTTSSTGPADPKELTLQQRASAFARSASEAVGWRETTSASPRSITPSDPSDPFDIAVQWLRRRSQLSIGFTDQLRLHSLYLQATSGDAHAAVVQCPELIQGTMGPLQRAKLLGWQALRGLPSWTARYRLPEMLAEVDSGFRAAHPCCAVVQRPRSRSRSGSGSASPTTSLTTVCLQALERRLTMDSVEVWAARAHRWLLWASGAATSIFAALVLRSRWTGGGARIPLKWRRFLPVAVVTCSALTLYSAALVHGAPAWLHADMRLRFGLVKQPHAQLRSHEDICDPSDAVGRMRRRFVRVFAPKVASSLFVE